jgi:hypothetical protein
MVVPKKQVAAAGAAVACVGWLTAMSPGVAHAQPPGMPQGTDSACTDVPGDNYAPDPADSNAYYHCVNGAEEHHFQCPAVTILVWGTPPKCMNRGGHHMP